MHATPIRSSPPFPARQQSNKGGVADRGDGASWVSGVGGGREANPLFRKTNRNSTNRDRRNSERVGLQAMRHFIADVNQAVGNSSPFSTYSSARPRTTGSVSQPVSGADSMGSVRAVHQNRPPSGYHRQQQQQQQPPQSQQPRLTRNLTLSDFRRTAPTAVAAIGGGSRYAGAGGDDGGGGGAGRGAGRMVRRGWQGGSYQRNSSNGIDSGNSRQLAAGYCSGGRSRQGIVGAEELSRLPLLGPSSPSRKLQRQQEGQHHEQLQKNVHASLENSELYQHGLSYGLSTLKGRRPYMEDEFKVIPNLELTTGSSEFLRKNGQEKESTHFFGMFDGHAGGRCSKALTQILAQTVSREPDFSLELQSAVHKGFLRANAEFLRKAERFCANDGSTAITAFLRGRRLVVGNVGDSRAVLCSDGRAVPMSSDHKPNKPEERRRIQALGGRVVYSFGVPRVNGILAVSRAFGDRNMKGAINAEPDVRERLLERHDEFLVLATDGVWDVMTSQEACNIVCSCADDVGPQGCSELLTATALRKGSLDNTSAMVVDFRGLWAMDSAAAAAGPRTNTVHSQENRASSPYPPSKAATGTGGVDADFENTALEGGAAGTRSRSSSASGPWASGSPQVRRDAGGRDPANDMSPSSVPNKPTLRANLVGDAVLSDDNEIGGNRMGRAGQQQQQQQQQRQKQQKQQKQEVKLQQHRTKQLQQQQHRERHEAGDTEGPSNAASATRSSRKQLSEAGAVGGGASGPGSESVRSIGHPHMTPWSSKAWGRSVAAGSVWSLADAKGSGCKMASPIHASSTSLATGLYGGSVGDGASGGAGAGGGVHFCSPSRRSFV